MTERLIPFDLEAAKADPSRVRWHSGIGMPDEVLFGKDDSVHVHWPGGAWDTYRRNEYQELRLTAPAPKRVEVRAALLSNGRFSLHDNNTFSFKSIESHNLCFVRWLTNWHIEDGKVFVEVE